MRCTDAARGVDYGADVTVQSLDLMQSRAGTWRLEVFDRRIGRRFGANDMGCITRLGCLFVLVGVAVVGWFTRDMWMSRLASRASHAPTAVVATEHWEPLVRRRRRHDASGAEAAQRASGPGLRDGVAGGARVVRLPAVAKRLPTAADSVEAMANGDKLSMRAVVSVSDLGGAIGDAVGIVHDRERVRAHGNARRIEAGDSPCSRSPTRGFTGCRSPRA